MNNTVTAKVSNYRAAPRKVRLIADFVRGKSAKKALAELQFVNKRHAPAIAKVIASAVANAKENTDLNADELIISKIQVQEGKTMKRYRAGSNGRGLPLRKRLSHISVELSEKVMRANSDNK